MIFLMEKLIERTQSIDVICVKTSKYQSNIEHFSGFLQLIHYM